jgi:hypothetical protein
VENHFNISKNLLIEYYDFIFEQKGNVNLSALYNLKSYDIDVLVPGLFTEDFNILANIKIDNILSYDKKEINLIEPIDCKNIDLNYLQRVKLLPYIR